jgi:hypothetical protein
MEPGTSPCIIHDLGSITYIDQAEHVFLLCFNALSVPKLETTSEALLNPHPCIARLVDLPSSLDRQRIGRSSKYQKADDPLKRVLSAKSKIVHFEMPSRRPAASLIYSGAVPALRRTIAILSALLTVLEQRPWTSLGQPPQASTRRTSTLKPPQ